MTFTQVREATSFMDLKTSKAGLHSMRSGAGCFLEVADPLSDQWPKPFVQTLIISSKRTRKLEDDEFKEAGSNDRPRNC
jgi:hypothetical protein